VTPELAALLTRERRRAVALLARQLGLGHLALAEDAVQTATLRALERWPRDGVPERPAAWLYRVAQRLAIDELRHTRPHTELPDDAEPEALAAPPVSESRLAGELNDDELALVFAACHPALPAATQVALALRSLLGLDLAAIAPLLFSTEAALAQRLARARVTLAAHTLAVPGGAELPPRREAVLSALALVFHHGQVAAGRQGHTPQGEDPLALCWEAIRLARALAAHPVTAAPEADALAALLLLHGARLSGRIDDAGDLVPLHGQPRERWDAGLIRLGVAHLKASQRGQQLTRWHLQAGIAAEHALAASPEATNWPAIARYYELLLAHDPSHAPRLGHAIALAEAGEPAEAEQALRALLPTVPEALQAHACAALARALVRQGRGAEAAGWWQRAINAAGHPAEARMLARARLGAADGSWGCP
jgi:RNA polymerase sigma-70 factor (ECF subfamily)